MSNHESIGKLISILHRKSHTYFQKKLTPLGMDRGQVKIFSYLAWRPGATQQELSEYFKLDKGTISYLIKNMEKDGYAMKKKNPADRRSSKIYLTQKAEKMEKRISKIFSGWTELLLNGFNEEERKQAFQILERMIGNVNFLNENKQD